MEVWLSVPEFEGLYEASSEGRIRSVERRIKKKNDTYQVYESKILKTWSGKHGHLYVSFSKLGKKTSVLVHRVIIATFIGPCPLGMEVCHNNGKPYDNRINNLRYGTRKENAEDSVRHGTSRPGELNSGSKLKAAEVLEILELRKAGNTITSVASRYGVTRAIVSRIENGKIWQSVTGF